MLIAAIMAGFAALGALPQDTLLQVQRGDRLIIENHRGDVIIDVWERDAVRIASDLRSGQSLGVARSGSTLRIRPRDGRGPANADLRVTVPRWIGVAISGNQLDVALRGTAGEIDVETVGGDITVQGGQGALTLRTIQGAIHVRDASGRVRAVSVNDDVEMTGIRGEVSVETTNGNITLRGIDATAVRATTVNGDVGYEGAIRDQGRYAFSTHNGSIAVTVPQTANATVSVSTYHGDFESDFPVRLTGTTRDRQYNFTVGSGSARLELESFNGRIRLRRP